MSPDTVSELLNEASARDWEAFCAAAACECDCAGGGQVVYLLRRWAREREIREMWRDEEETYR